MEQILQMPTPENIRPLPNYRLWLQFSDGVSGEVSLADWVGRGIFARWNSTAPFDAARIVHRHVIAWDDELEMDADSFYLELIGKTFEEWRESQLIHAAD
jgi:hypothetical protein